ncbi:MAG: YjbQ family protein [Lewinellaceae bacterium]|nr:YjbQ family protein [Lewinellaceae bacterium]
MKILTQTIEFATKGHTDILDLTPRIRQALAETGLREGQVTVFGVGSTTGISTVEYEPGLVDHDVKNMLSQIAPYGKNYQHNKAWGDDNGAAHLRSTLVGTSYVAPFSNGQLLLGTWQQVIFIDFDTRPRQRSVVLQFLGE